MNCLRTLDVPPPPISPLRPVVEPLITQLHLPAYSTETSPSSIRFSFLRFNSSDSEIQSIHARFSTLTHLSKLAATASHCPFIKGLILGTHSFV